MTPAASSALQLRRQLCHHYCMKYVVAVSGGVDSVAMLDMLVRANEHEVIVAHFDHGIRNESSADARFVAALAKQYNVPFELCEGNLGKYASEEQARNARYTFLRRVASMYDATIATAHHQDDVIETIAINLTRGTGWRGVAVLNDQSIYRPMLGFRKSELYDYALMNSLEWVEDETNATNLYLRNRLRRLSSTLDDAARQALIDIWLSQRKLAHSIDQEANALATVSRYFMTMVDEATASEILRRILSEQGLALTRPQRSRLLHAIKTARAGTAFEAGQNTRVSFTSREFIVKHP